MTPPPSEKNRLFSPFFFWGKGDVCTQAKIKTAQKIRMYKELRETTRTCNSVFNFLLFSIYCQCTCIVIGYNMGSLWFYGLFGFSL